MSTPEMRRVLGTTLEALMRQDERVVVLNADLAAAHGTARLSQLFPDRTFNVGVQEANMAGMAAGMATYGLRPYIVTFAPFATRRIADQLFVSIAYAHNNVKILGDPGVTAELNGGTHMTFEDVGLVRSYASMVIAEPADATAMEGLLPLIHQHPGPVYMRFQRKVAAAVYPAGHQFDLYTAEVLREGRDVSVFASGIEVTQALTAADSLAEIGIDAEVVDVHTIKPLDTDTVLRSVTKTGLAVTVENHNIIGGLGSAIAEVTAEHHPVPLRRVGSRDQFGEVGRLPGLLDRFGLTAGHIHSAVQEAVTTHHSDRPASATREEQAG